MIKKLDWLTKQIETNREESKMAGRTSRNIFVCRNVSIERNRDGNKKSSRGKKIIHNEIGTNIIDSTRFVSNRVESLVITQNRAEITRSKQIETNRNIKKIGLYFCPIRCIIHRGVSTVYNSP